jgi:ferrochelatase
MIYTKAGGGEYHYIPCLNERPDWMHALTDLVLKNLLGWTLASKPEELEASLLRARALGAQS